MRPIFLFLLFIATAATAQNTGLLFTPPAVYNNVGQSVPAFLQGSIPSSLDLSSTLPAVGSQLPQNSCVGWALGYTCRTYYNYKLLKLTRLKTDESDIASPAFIYNLLNNGNNKGISINRALRLLMDTGVCSYKKMPYDKYDWKTKPSATQIEDAKNFRIDTFKRIDLTYTVMNLKSELIAHNPVLCAVAFDNTFFNFGYNTKAKFYLWDTISKLEKGMGHAIVLVGYNDSLRAFKFMNSWGTNWGNSGYGWLSYKIASKVLREAYVIKPRLTVPKPHYLPKPTLPSIPPLPFVNHFRQEEVFTTEQFKQVQELLIKLLKDTLSNVVIQNVSISQDTNFAADKITLSGYAGIRNLNCNQYKVVVRFFYKENGKRGQPVTATKKAYQLISGQAATQCKTSYLQYDNTDWDIWQTTIPAYALKIPKGKQGKIYYEPAPTRLIAEPVLFVDDFPLVIGKEFEFEVRY